ncbi:MAG: tRNA 2-thiouridine(34) synthase MnmA [Acidobacteriota bacterium]
MKIAVLLSGGVDSSVAMKLLQEEGHQLTAFYLKVWLEDEAAFLGDCPWETDLEYVRAVCRDLGIPLEVVPLQAEYRRRVVEVAVRELKAGRTPSPDIFCNQRIKFGAFYDHIGSRFEKVATGHYARLEGESGNGARRLLRAPDPVKDQTYFLSHLDQPQLARALFPVGGLQKQQVRRLASRFGLPNSKRRDSQGICFLGKIRYRDFVRFHLGEKAGSILDIDSGKELGRHQGYWFHTTGQRQGLGLGGGPWYVVQKDVKRNLIFVAHQRTYLSRACRGFILADLNWISGHAPLRQRLQVKVRHGPGLIDCRIVPLPEGRWRVKLAQADPGVAPGQFGILYQREVCLGGGVIEG